MKLTLSTLAAALLLGSAQLASAATNPVPERDIASSISSARLWNQVPVISPDHCDQYSYGTGDDSCGTATGGPVGGLASGN